MSVSSNIADILRTANVRLCRLRIWSNYEGLGFSLEPTLSPPYLVGVVNSNSPAAAAGLKIRDIIFAVNNQDVSKVNRNQIKDAIKNARDNSGSVELLVVEERFYETLRKVNVPMNAAAAKIIDGPRTMPADYESFPQHQPRTCIINLNTTDVTLGFDVVHGKNDIGLFVQEVLPNTAASRTLLRKCDRIIVIDDEFVDDHESESIIEKLGKVKINGSVKLYVMDTETYAYYTKNKLLLSSKHLRKSQSENKLIKPNEKYSDYEKCKYQIIMFCT
jgi:C-terminal processing protease CtpA/Prc